MSYTLLMGVTVWSKVVFSPNSCRGANSTQKCYQRSRPSLMSFPLSPEGGEREPCLHQGLRSHRVNWLGLVWGSALRSLRQRFGGGVAWVKNTTQNTKQKTQQPSDRFKLLNNFIYPFYTHAHKTHFKYSYTDLTWI